MVHFEQEANSAADSDSPDGWLAVRDDGSSVPWRGLQTGPLTISAERLAEITRRLLGCEIKDIADLASRVLAPALGAKADLPALILHSTTPDLKTFDGDLDALLHGHRGGDFTTYKEARSVYLARPGDIAVGRTEAWRNAAEALGTRSVQLEDRDHYYLSHALLALADTHAENPRPSLTELIDELKRGVRVIKLYAFELEMQIFLLWLARQAGLGELPVEANTPAISMDWNRKDVLHPSVQSALDLDPEGGPELPEDPHQLLALEGRRCTLATTMDLEVPRIPGYTIERRGRSAQEFAAQTVSAAQLLRERHGLTLGCLKASESGDGARITPGLVLADDVTLSELALQAHVHGDDYVLEAHVSYGQVTIAGQTLPTALSAHIRGGEVAPGATIQFMEGTSWKGNILLDEQSAPLFQVSAENYRKVRDFLRQFHRAFAERAPGMVLAGIDFAIGSVGGRYGEQWLLGVQDLNISFTGAECLRSFLDKVRDERGEQAQACGVTRIFRPVAGADHQAFLDITSRFCNETVFADTVAAIPGRWGMVGITGENPRDAIDNLNRLQGALEQAGLIPEPV